MHAIRPCVAATIAVLISIFATNVGGGESPTPPLQFGKFVAQFTTPAEPTGLAFADDEVVIACSSAPFVQRVSFSDIEKNSTEIPQAMTPQEASDWSMPGAIAMEPTGNNFFIVEALRARVERVGENISASWGERGVADGEFASPRAIACDKNRVYVADTGNHRVQVFDYNGEHLLTFGGYGWKDGEFTNPRGIAVEAAGNIFVSDTDNHRIQKFDKTGRHLLTFGERGYYPGLLAEPCGIAVHGDELFVADRMNHRIQVFDFDGNVRYEWGLHVVKPGQGEGRFHYPDSIAISRDGKYAAVGESFQNRVQVFATAPKDTSPIAGWQQTEPGQSAHFGEKIHISGRLLFTSEPETSRVRVFDQSQPTPIEITNLGAYGRSPGRFVTIGGMTYDPERDWLFVCDPAGRRISVWHIDHRSESTVRFNPRLARFLYEIDVADLEQQGDTKRRWGASPEDVAWLSNKTLAVLDSANGVLNICRDDGRLVKSAALDDRDVCNARDIFVWPISLKAEMPMILVAGLGANQLWMSCYEFARDVLTVTEISPHILKQLETRVVAGVSAAPERTFLVTTAPDDGVFRVEQDGSFTALSADGDGLGRKQFFKPRGIAVDDSGAITIVDWGHHRLQTLSAEGEFLRVFGSRWYCEPIKRSKEGMPKWPYEAYQPDASSTKNANANAADAKTAPGVLPREMIGPLGRCRVRLEAKPSLVPLNDAFDLAIEVELLRDGEIRALSADADMPAHRHGMLVVPEVERVAPNKYEARGLRFHMPGYWEIFVDVTIGNVTERIAFPVEVD